MIKKNLTRRQQEISDYLQSHEHVFPFPPTLEELCHAMGVSSRGSMHKHIQALIAAGVVEPMVGRQRGIRLRPQHPPSPVSTSEAMGLEIPFLGYIAAGQPIEALAIPEMMVIPHWLRASRACYVLQVKGDSMIDEGILDGDWVIIEKRDWADNGEIVVALVDNNDATLKRIEQVPGKTILHPANANMKPMSFAPEQVRVQGILVGQMRTYR